MELCLIMQIAAFMAPCTANVEYMQSEVVEQGLQPATDT